MRAQGFDEAALARIHAPIGLDIGAVSPAEIAVSIIGEIVGLAAQKAAAFGGPGANEIRLRAHRARPTAPFSPTRCGSTGSR